MIYTIDKYYYIISVIIYSVIEGTLHVHTEPWRLVAPRLEGTSRRVGWICWLTSRRAASSVVIPAPG